MRKKKTYIFNEQTLQVLSELKKLTSQTETQILSDALYFYLKYKGKENGFLSKIDYVFEKIERLSFELGRCQERVRYLEEKLEEKKL